MARGPSPGSTPIAVPEQHADKAVEEVGGLQRRAETECEVRENVHGSAPKKRNAEAEADDEDQVGSGGEGKGRPEDGRPAMFPRSEGRDDHQDGDGDNEPRSQKQQARENDRPRDGDGAPPFEGGRPLRATFEWN